MRTNTGLQLARAEGVALFEIAPVNATAKPAHALRRGAMRKRLGADRAARLLLQPVIADGRRCGETFFDIAALEDMAGAVGVIGPHAGKAVGLQLKANRQPVGAGLVGALLRRRHLFFFVQDVRC